MGITHRRGGTRASYEQGLDESAVEAMATDFMKQHKVPGLSVAVERGGRTVFERSFGTSNRETGESLSASHRFRIASLTKPITSVAVFSLIEQSQFRLTDRVFGKASILGMDYGTPPYKRYVEDITVDPLLTHACGGWPNDWDDPTYRFPKMNQAQLLSWTLDHVLLSHRLG